MKGRAKWLLIAALGGGCESHKAPCPEPPTARPVDASLLAFLSRARSAHHAADRAEDKNDLATAVRVLGEIVSGPLPAGGTEGRTEVREVLADTLARLADLRSRSADFKAAEADIERGLRLAREPSYFRGHLYEVSGLMWERRAKLFRDQGDAEAARKASERSLEAFEKSMKIQANVIRDSAVGPARKD